MGRTTRICSLAALATLTGCAQTRVVSSPFADYARARIAPDDAQAAQSFGTVLSAAPTNLIVAYRAYREAIVAGDFALALRAAQALERQGTVPPEAKLLFYIAALRQHDARDAAERLTTLAPEPSFAFVAPQLADWLAFGTRANVDLAAVKDIGGPNAYAAESDALLAIARGDVQGGMDRVRTLWPLDPYRAQSLRLAAAAGLAARGNAKSAATLLIADTEATRIARRRIAAGQKLGIAVDSPATGAAFVIARMAGDLTVEGSGFGAIALARMAQFADPKNARIALSVAGALSGAKRHRAALVVTDTLLNDPVYGDDAASLRIDLLEALDRRDEALAAAILRAARSPNDTARLGDIELRRGNFASAAIHFDAAIAQSRGGASWALWHAAGNAHRLAGDWESARAALEQAFTLAPDEPLVLNSLGFALVDHGTTPERGGALLARAAELQPGNSSIIDALGWAALKAGRVEEAVKTLERAQSLAPAAPAIGEHLGDAYWASGRRIDARYAWAAAHVAADGAVAARIATKIAQGLP